MDALVEAVEEAGIAGQPLVAGDDADDRPDARDDRQEADADRQPVADPGAPQEEPPRHVAEDGDDGVAERGCRRCPAAGRFIFASAPLIARIATMIGVSSR